MRQLVRPLALLLVLAPSSACAVLGAYDLSDYGGTTDDGDAAQGDAPQGDGAPLDGAGDETIGDASDDTIGRGDGAASDGALDGTKPDAPNDGASDSDARPGDGAQPDVTPPICMLGTQFKHVFVTSTTYSVVEIGSLTNADALCSLAAKNMAGVFKAWLSDDSISAGARLSHAVVPYVLVDQNTIVACNWSELTSNTLRHGIDMTELGGAAPLSPGCGTFPDLAVFTGTEPTGVTAAAHTCTSWTAPSGMGAMGFAHQTATNWSDGCAGSVCGGRGAIYCIEQ